MENLYDEHWNADGDAKTHGDVCDNHVAITLKFAIECLNKVRDKIVVEPEGNGFDEDVSTRSNERWRADGIIQQQILKLNSSLTPQNK